MQHTLHHNNYVPIRIRNIWFSECCSHLAMNDCMDGCFPREQVWQSTFNGSCTVSSSHLYLYVSNIYYPIIHGTIGAIVLPVRELFSTACFYWRPPPTSLRRSVFNLWLSHVCCCVVCVFCLHHAQWRHHGGMGGSGPPPPHFCSDPSWD